MLTVNPTARLLAEACCGASPDAVLVFYFHMASVNLTAAGRPLRDHGCHQPLHVWRRLRRRQVLPY